MCSKDEISSTRCPCMQALCLVNCKVVYPNHMFEILAFGNMRGPQLRWEKKLALRLTKTLLCLSQSSHSLWARLHKEASRNSAALLPSLAPIVYCSITCFFTESDTSSALLLFSFLCIGVVDFLFSRKRFLFSSSFLDFTGFCSFRSVFCILGRQMRMPIKLQRISCWNEG